MGTRGAGAGRVRAGGVRRRSTGGIEGDLVGELLANVLDSKTIRTVAAGEGTPRILESRRGARGVRSFDSAETAADRARQVLMRLRTVHRRAARFLINGRPAIEVAQQRLAVLQGMQTSARQDPDTGRWLPIFAVSTRGAPILRDIMTNAGVQPVRTALGRGWFTIRR